MLYTIRNEDLMAQVSSSGAQLMSLEGKNHTQYLWQGNPRYWSDRSLTIFPYVARLTKGCYRYKGKFYHMSIHGFGPSSDFSVFEQTESCVAFRLESNPKLYKMYPFDFRFTVFYRLQGSALEVTYYVENIDKKIMYFGLGGHPGINVPLENGLRFEDYALEFFPCQPRQVEFTSECYITGRESSFPLENNRLSLSHSLFDDDAIVLTGTSGQVTLRSSKGKRGVTLISPDFPILGLWHAPKTDAPYICLEPWSSLPSHQDVIEDLEQQADLIALPPKEIYKATWRLLVF